MTGDEIGMKVGQEDVGNMEVVIRREGQILIDVTLRIDDSRVAALLVRDDVGCVRQTVQVKLLEDHLSIMTHQKA
jgi:hypothetical protein